MLFEYDYDVQQEGIQRLKINLLSNQIEEEEVDQLLHEVWNDLSYGLEVQGIYARCLEKIGLSSKELPVTLFEEIDQSCRKFIYRGHTYLEIIN